jgi:ferredoxin hydrogenase small subunit
MSIAAFTRRQFLKAGCMACGAAIVGIRFTGKALAAVKQVKEYMTDRINSVYAADKTFVHRASQDNPQVMKLYKDWLEHPMSHKAEQFLHMHWTDRSQGIQKLIAERQYPNPRAGEFGNGYPYE